jgi:AcrR family transcriptional regulator
MKKEESANNILKEKIFRAAQKLFVEKGYHNTSIPDIVKEAGVSTGAIYHYYSSKEELAKEIHRTAVEQYLEKYNEEVGSQQTSYDKIRAVTSLLFRWAENDPIMVQYLLYGRPNEILDKRLSVCSEEGLTTALEIVDWGTNNGEIRSMNRFLAAAAISGYIIRMIQLRFDGLIKHSLVEFVEATTNNIWLSLKI